MDNNEALLALLAATLGGIGVKVIDFFINKDASKRKHLIDTQTQTIELRTELWREVQDLKARQTSLEQEVVCWKDKYYQLLKEYNGLQVSFDSLTKQYDALKERIDNLVAIQSNKLHETTESVIE